MVSRNRYCLIFFVIVCAILLSACQTKQTETPWRLASTLSEDMVNLAVVWANLDGHVQNRALTADETEELIDLINQIPETAYTENSDLSGSTPEYGVEIICDNMTLRLNQNIGPYGAIELAVNQKNSNDGNVKQWHVDSNDLSNLLVLLSGYKKSEQSASATDISSTGANTPAGQLLERFTGAYGIQAALFINGEFMNATVQPDWYAARDEQLFSLFKWDVADAASATLAAEKASFVLEISAVIGKATVREPGADAISFFGGTDYVLLHEDGEDRWYKTVRKNDLASETSTLATVIRQEYDGFEISTEQICFSTEQKQAKDIAACAIEAYGQLYENVSPGSVYAIYAYDFNPENIQILETAADGRRFTFNFVFEVRPVTPDTAFWWAGNTGESDRGAGWLSFGRNARLELGDDGFWTVSQFGTGGASLED